MPLDAMTYDTLADIDPYTPLSVRSVKRIVRAARGAGILSMDHAIEYRGGFEAPASSPYLSPHGAVDAFLGPHNRASCPCNMDGPAHRLLTRLMLLHCSIFYWRAVRRYDEPFILDMVHKFDELTTD
jgi:hypothetical protein